MDRVLFAKHFFGPKIAHEFSRFHHEILRAPKVPFRERPPMTGWRRALMVPRGNGKSTVAIRIEVVHDIVYEFEEFIVILAESAALARSRMREAGLEFIHNKELIRFFGDLKGEPWRLGSDQFTANGVTVQAKSRQSQVRGIQHEVTAARPSKVILDDFEDSEAVLNPELREKDARFLREDVEGGGTTDGRTCFQMTGTPLHREALLPSLEKNPGWDFRKYPAIVRWPDRMDLWEKCRAIFTAAGGGTTFDPERPDLPHKPLPTAVEQAHRFYKAHGREMDRGAIILWPQGEPLFALMVFRWTNGEAAFSKEKLLVPRDPSLATFVMDSDEYPAKGALRHRIEGPELVIDQRDGKTRRVLLSALNIVSFHDPAKADKTSSKGKTSLGDYACISTVGFERLTFRGQPGGMAAHVLNVWIERQPPSLQIEAHFDIYDHWRHSRCILEVDNLALLKADYRDEARRRREQGRTWQMPLRGLERQSVRKDVRIAAMEPAVTNGWLTFNEDVPDVYWNQWVDHPTGDHDDGPDSTEGAWRNGQGKAVGLSTVPLR